METLQSNMDDPIISPLEAATRDAELTRYIEKLAANARSHVESVQGSRMDPVIAELVIQTRGGFVPSHPKVQPAALNQLMGL